MGKLPIRPDMTGLKDVAGCREGDGFTHLGCYLKENRAAGVCCWRGGDDELELTGTHHFIHDPCPIVSCSRRTRCPGNREPLTLR